MCRLFDEIRKTKRLGMFPVGLMPEQVSERGSTFSQQTHKLRRTGLPKKTYRTVGKTERMRKCFFLFPPWTTFFDIAKRECFRVELNKHGHREPRKCVQCPLASTPILITNNASNNMWDRHFLCWRARVLVVLYPPDNIVLSVVAKEFSSAVGLTEGLTNAFQQSRVFFTVERTRPTIR